MCIYLVCATSKKEKQMRQLNEIQDVGLVTLQTLELETRCGSMWRNMLTEYCDLGVG